MKRHKPRRQPRTATIGVQLKLTECSEHGAHVTDVDVMPPTEAAAPTEVAYESADADQKIASVGWSRAYGDGWDRVFGPVEDKESN